MAIRKITKHVLQELVLSMGNVNINVDILRVKSISISKDYFNKMVPDIVININMKLEDYRSLLTQTGIMKGNIKMTCQELPVNDEGDTENRMSFPFLTGEFYARMSEHTPKGSQKLEVDQSTTEGAQATNEESSANVTLMLTMLESLGKYRTLINGNFEADVESMLKYMLYQSGITKDVIMSSVDNKTSYTNLVIPGLNLIGSMKYIHENYGIYNTPFLFFMDTQYTYLLNTGPDPKATVTTDKKLKINIIQESDVDALGLIRTSDMVEVGVSVTKMRYTVTNSAIENSYNSFLVSDTDKTTVVENKEVVSDNGIMYQKHLVSPNSNTYFPNSLMAENKLYKEMIMISLPNVNSMMYKPNIIIDVENSDNINMNGSYRVVSLVDMLTQNEQSLSSTTMLTLYKVK